MDARPYLSVVVTSRNDDHGGSMLRRMQTFVNALLAQCRRFALPAELIVVEWNPPAGRAPLSEALSWPADTGPCSVRFIEVPEALHRRFGHADALPLFQMIAKNVGIRRARGEYVVATNIDILFNDELMRFLAGRRLQPGKMYRIDRHDAETFVPVDAPVEEQLEYCRTHLLRVNARGITIPVTPNGVPATLPDDVAQAADGIGLGSGWYLPEKSSTRWFRWIGTSAELVITAGPTRPPVLAIEGELFNDGSLQQGNAELRDADGNLVGRVPLGGRETLYFAIPDAPADGRYRLHIDCRETGFPLDPRTLRYQVYRCYRVGAIPDDARPGEGRAGVSTFLDRDCRPIGPAEGGLEFGCRWFPLETFCSETFRWFGEHARLKVRRPAPDRNVLNLLIETGPAVHWGPATLTIRDATGDTVLTFGLNGGRQVISIPVNTDLADWEFDVSGECHRLTSDPRLLKARILAASWASVPSPFRRAVHSGLRMAGRAARRLKPVIAPPPVIAPQEAAGAAAATSAACGAPAEPPPFPRVAADRPVDLHTNACGDFTLMHIQHWLDIRGYPEFDTYSMNIDSLGCYMAHHAGAVEEILTEPMRVYHIEHGAGSGWTPEGEGKLRARMAAKGIPWLEYREVLKWAVEMRRLDAPLIFNKEDWGFGNERLPETVLGLSKTAERRAGRAAA